MNKKLVNSEDQVIQLEEINFDNVEQLEDVASPGFVGTVFCGC